MKTSVKIRGFAVILIFLTTLLASCATTVNRVFPEKKHWIVPELNAVGEAYIGDTLIKEGTSSETEAIILRIDHGKAGWSTVHPKGTYKFVGTTTKSITDANRKKIGTKTYKVYEFGTQTMGAWGYKYPKIIEDENGELYLLGDSYNTKLTQDNYSRTTVLDVDGYYLEQQLIYTGCDGDILKFTYREFADKFARASFSVDATYDLSKSNVIRFKGASLEILNYGNQNIKYKVLTGFKEESGQD